jgi:hypothetical protein
VKAIAILLAGGTVFGTLAASLLAWFVETFCDENCTPDDPHPAGLTLLGLLAFVCACLVLACIALDRGRLALAAYTGQAVAAFALLSKALNESSHSDGKLLLFALAVELPAAAAVAISMRKTPATCPPAAPSRSA